MCIRDRTRTNIDVGLNDTVTIKKIVTKPAKSITLSPVSDTVTVDKEFSDFVKNRLKGLPLSHGDEISVMILGNAMNFKISKISPKGVIRIERATTLTNLSEKSDDKKFRIKYEEVGGLRSEIKVMREIV